MSYKYGIVANPEIPNTLQISKRVIEFFGGDIVVESSLLAALKKTGTSLSADSVPLKDMEADVVITVGGDGTILKTVQNVRGKILGINTGNLGFMAEVQPENLEDALQRLESGDYAVEERLRLRTELNGRRLLDSINEAVIHTDRVAKIRRFSVEIDGVFVEELRADGLILSTPTGSTCYSMSVGGPIVDPRVPAFVLVSIAAFSRHIRRPLVVPTSSRIKVTFPHHKSILLVLDGQEEFYLKGDEALEFTEAERPAEFIRMYSDFYSNLRKKIQG